MTDAQLHTLTLLDEHTPSHPITYTDWRRIPANPRPADRDLMDLETEGLVGRNFRGDGHQEFFITPKGYLALDLA